ncbi:hypothetical protein HK405_010789, partial [Cladochytrium tenue]
VMEAVRTRIGGKVRVELRRNVPLDVDWDGSVRRYEAVDVAAAVAVEDLDPDAHGERLAFLAP